MRWLVVIAGIAALVGLLFWQFPYAAQSSNDKFRVFYSSLLLVLLVGSAAARSRVNTPDTLKYLLAWICIIVVLVLAYSYRDVLTHNRLVAELVPQHVQVSADGTLSVRTAMDGHFHLVATVNGAQINFMVDTGASDIMLSRPDAERAGFAVQQLRYTRSYDTANGTVGGAPVKLHELKVGPVVMRGIDASINGGETDGSLLGMRFLRQFRSYRVEGDTLTLVP